MEAVWLGFGEIAVLMTGGWVLFAKLAGLRPGSPLTLATGENGVHLARMLFAVSLIPIGLSHLVYVKQTAELVPAWLPYRVGWAYLTGAGQIACGLGVAVLDLPARGRARGSGHGQPVYASRLGSCDSCSADGTAAVDGIFHLVGHRVRRMGSGPKHRTQAACPAGCVTLRYFAREIWWRRVDSNHGPTDYETVALAT